MPGAAVDNGRDSDTHTIHSTTEIAMRAKFKHTEQVSFSSNV